MAENWLNKFSAIIDENKQLVRGSLYCVALTGVLYSIRSVRPFKKFCHASEIPQTFIEKKVKLNGTVTNIEIGSSVLLRVNHNPIFASKLRKKCDPGLAVKISSVNITSNGISWLQHMLMNRCIHFVLLKVGCNKVDSVVLYNDKNIAEELLKLGFATVDAIDFDLQNDKYYSKYYKKLLKLENLAEMKRLGIWANTEYNIVTQIKNRMIIFLYDLFRFK